MTLVLVSDGKETCQGDPCVVAQNLADANVDLVIHTVGLGVNSQMGKFQIEGKHWTDVVKDIETDETLLDVAWNTKQDSLRFKNDRITGYR